VADAGRQNGQLSVSYPADRRLQAQREAVLPMTRQSFSILSCGSSVARALLRCRPPWWPRCFQYPILRIVGCKCFPLRGCGGNLDLSVSYPADRRLQDGVLPAGANARKIFQYPILRIVGCKASSPSRASGQGKLSVSYPADRRLQERRSRLTQPGAQVFQYPILRIVGCKCVARTVEAARERPFSILSCGSSVASSHGFLLLSL